MNPMQFLMATHRNFLLREVISLLPDIGSAGTISYTVFRRRSFKRLEFPGRCFQWRFHRMNSLKQDWKIGFQKGLDELIYVSKGYFSERLITKVIFINQQNIPILFLCV